MRRFAWLLLALLGGCSSSSGDLQAWFPLSEGRSWQYQISTRGEDPAAPVTRSTLTLQTLGASSIEGLSGGPAYLRRSDDGVDYWLRQDDTGIYRVGMRSELQELIQLDPQPRYVLKFPIAVGTTWQAPTTAYLLKRRQEFPREIRHSHPSIPMTYVIESLDEAVSVPAGDFKACLRVRGEGKVRLFVDPVQGWRDVPLVTQEWYCRGVGLVKLIREETAASTFLSGGSTQMELLATP